MICVKRDEIITMMQEQQILMTKRLQDAIIKMSNGELVARWAGIQLLAEEHRPGNRPGWMGKHFCNPTTLFVGQRELDRKALAEARRQELLKKRLEEAAIEAELSREKLKFWNRCTTKRKLLEKHLVRMDETFQEMIRKNFLDGDCDLEAMPEQQVLFWFWYLVPPFEIDRTPPAYVLLEKAS